MNNSDLSSHRDCTHAQLLRMLQGEEARLFDQETIMFLFNQDTFCRPAANKNGVQSRDTLQSLVQSCRCGEDIQSECPNEQMMSHQNYLMSFLEKHVGFTSHTCSPSITFQQDKQINISEKEAKKRNKRIRWTDDLHNRFMESVDSLGGPKKATPKAILKLMNCSGLTIFHIKSHLQKHRVAQLIPDSTEGDADDEQINSKTKVQIVEALRLQMDVQKRLYEQLESQKKLQIRIEEQAKQLHTMIQCQMNTTTTK